jgi:hypothetical protein
MYRSPCTDLSGEKDNNTDAQIDTLLTAVGIFIKVASLPDSWSFWFVRVGNALMITLSRAKIVCAVACSRWYAGIVHPLAGYPMENSAVLPECAICFLPCPLETCKVDANGKAVHAECIVARTLSVPLHEE